MTANVPPQSAACPQCGAVLLAHATSSGAELLTCPACRQRFQWDQPAAGPPPLAGASLALGLAAIVGNIYTGIPAVLLGWAALRNPTLRRSTRCMAWGGIVSAVVFSLFGMAVVGLMLAGQVPAIPVQRLLASAISTKAAPVRATPTSIVTVARGAETVVIHESPPVVVPPQDDSPTTHDAGPTTTTAPVLWDTSEMAALVDQQASWSWLHPTDGNDPALATPEFHTSFFLLDFDDASWNISVDETGSGFGYGDPVAISIGMPKEGLRHTAYFRCRFSTDRDYEQLLLQFYCDDGVMVYLDGVEVARENITGDEQYTGRATQAVGGDDETRIRQLPLQDPLPAGEHVLSISVHNVDPNRSTDLRLGNVALWGK